MVRKLFSLALACMMAAVASAEIKLPAILGNDMVLQRNSEVNLWGTATPDKNVTVRTSWNGKKYKTKSDADGKWALKVATGEAGGWFRLVIMYCVVRKSVTVRACVFLSMLLFPERSLQLSPDPIPTE